jgi:UDP:flavonoid glycosyltransferase YjiC (YdhE family)
VPGMSMAQRSDVMVHHGGYGSCQAALWAGRPSVILPTYSERESNARRMEGAGAAIRVPVEITADTKQVDAGLYRAGVDRALEDRAFRARAEELAVKLRTFGGPVAAADVIEQISNPNWRR